MTKLYEVPRWTKIRVCEEVTVPPDSPKVNKGDVLNFRNIDGMYSLCFNFLGHAVHIPAWAEVEVVE